MDRYKVVKRIGVGTYGSAYLVTSKSDPAQQYVLKKVKLDDANEKERVQAETEVQVLRHLDHPLVLSYVDHFMYKGHLCIVTEYCEGGDLAQLLRARKAPLLEGQILELLTQILMAMQYMHSKGILHRDLKTANIFLTKDGSIKLGDFGISRSLSSSLDLAQTIIGTPYYMSPEVMSSQPYDFKSDMWSLGCCLYEMMTLKHAFDATDLTSLVLKVMRGEHLPIPDTFSMALRDTAKQLLSKGPKLRPSPEQCLKSPLLKDFTYRIRERVAYLETQKTRRRSPQRAIPPARTSSSGASGSLDAELALAQERLRRIKMERDALREQIAGGVSSSGSSAAAGAAGEDVSPVRTRSVADGGVPVLLNRRASYGASAAAPSQPPTRPSYAALESTGRLGPRRSSIDVGGAGADGMERGGGTSSLPPSFSTPPPQPTHGGHHAASAFQPSFTDPKARKEARRQEEIRKREAELLDARKAYFEARRGAEAQKYNMYHGAGPGGAAAGGVCRPSGLTAERSTSGLPGMGGGTYTRAGGNVLTGRPPLPGSGTNGTDGQGGFAAQQFDGLSLDDSDDEFYTASAQPGPGDAVAATREFESELLLRGGGGGGSAEPALARTYNVGAALADRASAMRGYCVNALGQQIFDLIYGQLRRRVGGGPASDEHVFRQELQARLGPSRMQHVQLIDQLIYFEDAYVAQAR
ncbi:hypothetical protein FOA52_008910 [Chlamydomonas sp. UWO 241]|nr:hypothetical protein FOA52_008910 [Chlamydomonas sp. UWO 241]